MLALVMLAWVGGRAATWENPFPPIDLKLPGSDLLFAGADRAAPDAGDIGTRPIEAAPFRFAGNGAVPSRPSQAGAGQGSGPGSAREFRVTPEVQYGHHLLWLRALGAKLTTDGDGEGIQHAIAEPQRLAGVTPIAPPFEEQQVPGRWSFDAWAFWREGSNAAPVSQGRVPIYGASQVGANLQFRVAPSSMHDPRLFARAYRALVTNGESEVAFGASARPVGSVPVRVAAELRVTDRRFGTDLRPAVIAVTELPPQSLPAGFRLEAYGGAGYVGGKGATAFADGQAAVTREVVRFGGGSADNARLSVGAGAWGGAQKDANRVDVGPTVRVDLAIGEVPARLSVDWRERVAGDASPDSGVAATLSTRF